MSTDKPPQTMRLPISQQRSAHAVIAQAATAQAGNTALVAKPSQWQIGSRYVLLVLIWSSTPLAVVLSVRELHPIWALTIRFVLAAVLAYIICRAMNLRLPLHKIAIQSYVAGSLSLLGAMLLTYLAAAYLASGLISLLFGFSPIVAGLLGYVFGANQKLYIEQWVGMLIAVLGLGFICLAGESSFVNPLGVALILLAVVCYVASMFWVKQLQAGLHPLVQTTGSLILSAIGMLAIIPFFWGFVPQHVPSLVTIGAVVYSVVVASIIAMLCYFDLVQRLSPSTVALSTILTPVLALGWGALFNHEQINRDIVLGVTVVLAGLILYFLREWYQGYVQQSASKI